MRSSHYLQFAVDGQVGQVIEQSSCLASLLHRNKFILGGRRRIRQPRQHIITTRIVGRDGYQLNILAHHNLDGVFV